MELLFDSPPPNNSTFTPHLLRHTQFRKVTRKTGIEAAMELSGHNSERYIWLYIQASEDEMEEALTDLWD